MQTSTAAARPFLPADSVTNKSLARACWAATAAAARNTNQDALCAKIFPDDPVALHLLRSAISGANLTTPAWAGVLAQRAVAEWLGSLAPASAAAELIRRGTVLPLGNSHAPLTIPTRTNGPTALSWVAEAAPIPVRNYAFGTAQLAAKKMAVLVVMTKELARYSDASVIFDAMLREDAAVSLDAAYFSTDDGTTTGHHAGLLAGLTPIAGSNDMAGDLAALAAAVGANGSGQVVFIMSPGRAASAGVRVPAEASAVILPSLVPGVDEVIAVDPVALVHGFVPAPEIMSTEEAVMHMSDTPAQLGVAGTPNVVAAPSQSLFQTAQIALRLFVEIAFAARRSGAVAYADGCTW